MSTHNICFHGKIRKKIIWMPFLSKAMVSQLYLGPGLIEGTLQHSACFEQYTVRLLKIVNFSLFANTFYEPCIVAC